MKYAVNWREEWKRIAKLMSFAICIPLCFLFIARYFSNDMSLEITFEHISILELPLFFGAIILFSIATSFLIALYIKASAVEVVNGLLIGRNYWCFKRRIPVKEITKIYQFSNNGIDVLVANGGKYGEVFISKHTEELDTLLKHLSDLGAPFDGVEWQ